MTDVLTLQNTAIVLDSTCDPPEGFFDRPGLFMVPLKVHFGDETYPRRRRHDVPGVLRQARGLRGSAHHVAADRRGVPRCLRGGQADLRPRLLAAHLGRDERHRAFRRAGRRGRSTGSRSTTCAPSRARCRSGAERLRARLERGCTLDEARAYIKHFTDHSSLLVHAATLEYLRRGGRIGRAASLVGGVFDIKPLIRDRRRHPGGLRQGARPQEGHGRHAALRRGEQHARRRAVLRAPSTPSTTKSRSSSAR